MADSEPFVPQGDATFSSAVLRDIRPAAEQPRKELVFTNSVNVREVGRSDEAEAARVRSVLIPDTLKMSQAERGIYESYITALIRNGLVYGILNENNNPDQKLVGIVVLGQDEENSNATTVSMGRVPDVPAAPGEMLAGGFKMSDILLMRMGIPDHEARMRLRATGQWDSLKKTFDSLLHEKPIRGYVDHNNKDPVKLLGRMGMQNRGDGKGEHSTETLYELDLDAFDGAWDSQYAKVEAA